MQGRNILLFVDSCATHPKGILFTRNVKVVYYPTNCRSILESLDLGIMRRLRQLYRMHVVQAGIVLRKLNTLFPFKTVYFLGVRGFTVLSYVVYDSLFQHKQLPQ
jgi:hypothetical protein